MITPAKPKWLLDATKLIRGAVDKIEAYTGNQSDRTRRQAEIQLAWHHLINAHELLMKSRLAPDDLAWGSTEAAEILGGQ